METATIETFRSLDEFTLQYLDTALWLSHDDDDTPLDQEYGITDMCAATVARAIADCSKFQIDHESDLEELPESSAGHCFWLTRNSHGTGFWDRGLGDDGRLTKASEKFGPINLHVEDGVVVGYPG